MTAKTPRRGPHTADEQDAIEQALAAGRVTVAPKPAPLGPSPRQVLCEMLAGQRDPRR